MQSFKRTDYSEKKDLDRKPQAKEKSGRSMQCKRGKGTEGLFYAQRVVTSTYTTLFI